MIDALIQEFDDEVFGRFLNSKLSGSFSASRSSIPVKKDFGWENAERLGIVKKLAGLNGSNMPLLVVAAKLHDGETLKERSSRIKQFKFAKQVLDDAMSNPAPGVEGILSQGLFVFHDDHGNFRLSLVYGRAEGTKLVWSTAKRLSFHVQAGDGNKTFRDRMALPWSSFDQLKEAFSVEKLTKEFYNRLFNWYQWALSDEMNVTYPNDTDRDDDDREINEHIIRLITRLMFVWFLKQKHLVPDNLFDPAELKKILKNFSPTTGDNYYRAILQNLFFATLNSEISERAFAVDAGKLSVNREHFDIKTLYRYGGEFAGSEKEVLTIFAPIPFLNGGLFECLDRGKNYCDGFSRNARKQARIPNRLFFDAEAGLIPLLQQYNFTVEENSPGDEEVALDPELLGKVFENLLGAYNPETKLAARNATGSFYTPREIVNYMVDESLIAHLTGQCGEENAETIRRLFTDGERPADKKLRDALDKVLVTAKILDPAEFDIQLVSENHTNVYITDSRVGALFTLGVLNSHFLDFYFRLFNSNTQVASGELNRLPIPRGGERTQKQIALIVDRILAVKKADPTADTSALEDEIDELVYELYSLTPEEKEIVKASVSRGGAAVVEDDEEETDAVAVPEPKKKPAKKRKVALPPSLLGWD